MKINNSSDFDLDLFFREDIYLKHFATAGLQVSNEVFFDNSHNNFRNWLKSFSRPRFEYRLNPSLNEIISFKLETDPKFDLDLYTADFKSYAELGLFSYDRTFIDKNDDNHFHLVAFPILNNSYNELLNHIYSENIDLNYNFVNKEVDYLNKKYYHTSFKQDFSYLR
jgi:hypothetical protein